MMTMLGLIIANLIICFEFSNSAKLQRIIKFIYIATALALSLFIVSYWIFGDYSSTPEGYSINFNPVAYPIIQQYFGNELLVNFKSLYGLHPFFMQIFLYIFPATVLTLSASVALLFLVSLLSLTFFIFKIIENKLLALTGFFMMIYLQNFSVDGRFAENGVTFQY